MSTVYHVNVMHIHSNCVVLSMHLYYHNLAYACILYFKKYVKILYSKKYVHVLFYEEKNMYR